MTQSGLFDPGLQPERTELAWRRTALSIGIGSLICLRVLPAAVPVGLSGPQWLLPGLIGLIFCSATWTLARTRSLRTNRALRSGIAHKMPGAGLMFALTSFVVVSGVIALLFVLGLRR